MDEEFIVTLIALISSVGMTWLVQFRSVLSPGYLAFDGSREKEMRLMRIYNQVMDRCFGAYAAVIVILMAASYILEDISLAKAGLLVQIIYFGAALAAMIIMYCRNYLYWERRGDRFG